MIYFEAFSALRHRKRNCRWLCFLYDSSGFLNKVGEAVFSPFLLTLDMNSKCLSIDSEEIVDFSPLLIISCQLLIIISGREKVIFRALAKPDETKSHWFKIKHHPPSGRIEKVVWERIDLNRFAPSDSFSRERGTVECMGLLAAVHRWYSFDPVRSTRISRTSVIDFPRT